MNLFPNATKFVVNAPETHVWSPRPSNSNGISIYPNNHIFFNGMNEGRRRGMRGRGGENRKRRAKEESNTADRER